MNKNFYPTPDDLISRMIRKIRNKNIQTILEPSAGEGHIADKLENHYEHKRGGKIINCIEIFEDKKTYNKHLGNCSFAEVIFNVNNQLQEGTSGD